MIFDKLSSSSRQIHFFFFMKNCVSLILTLEKDNAPPLIARKAKKHVLFFSCIHGHTEEIKMATALLTAVLKTFGRN